MLEISNIKLPCGSGQELLDEKIRKLLHTETFKYTVARHSVDARKKPELYDIYTVHATLGRPSADKAFAIKMRRREIRYIDPVQYRFPAPPESAPVLHTSPVVVGSGPAGLFAALLLAENGFRPVLLERGAPMEERIRDVESFWKTGSLKENSNIQFGEGGAGTFSDGKLTTNVKDRSGRNAKVLQEFVEAGAPGDICYEHLPHIGTDILRRTIVNLRKKLLLLGGEVRFHSLVTELIISGSSVTGVRVDAEGGSYVLEGRAVILAPGHSARDLFRTLERQEIELKQKNFAVGFRVTHPQAMINAQQYGTSDPETMKRLRLPAASYKLTESLPSGRGIYTFCMCPGGYVVNASSAAGMLAVNGMSDYARDSKRANSAVIMTVGAKEFGSEEPLAGMYFQEKLEREAYRLADGRIPVQPYREFAAGLASPRTEPSDDGQKDMPAALDRELSAEEESELCLKGKSAFAPLHTLLPRDMGEDFVRGMQSFDERIPGFAGEEAYVCGLESRTSSPVRILRDETLQSVSVRGLFPCGEGAGYAGGIMSAAIDGIKAAEAVANAFRPNKT